MGSRLAQAQAKAEAEEAAGIGCAAGAPGAPGRKEEASSTDRHPVEAMRPKMSFGFKKK